MFSERRETEHMRNNSKNWLQVYVDAMTERDPYKRLALVRELRQMPKHDESEEWMDLILENRSNRKEIRRPSRDVKRSSKIKRSRTR